MRQTFDGEKSNPSIARLKHSGHTFEIVIDPQNALKVRRKEGSIHDALMAPHIYKDVDTGEVASAELMQALFKTADEYKVAEKIILEGELHFSEEYKTNLRNEKKEKVVAIIARDAADMNTGLPFTEKRIHSAITQAGINIDLFKGVEEQLPEIIAKLRAAIPLTLEKKSVILRIPSKFAPKLYGFVSSKSTIVEQAWLGDGALSAKVELPAGAVAGFIDELKKSTHGDVEVSIEKKLEAKKK